MKGNIYEKWFFYVGKFRVSWNRKHGICLGKKIEGINPSWGVTEEIFMDKYHWCLNLWRLNISYSRDSTFEDCKRLIYDK